MSLFGEYLKDETVNEEFNNVTVGTYVDESGNSYSIELSAEEIAAIKEAREEMRVNNDLISVDVTLEEMNLINAVREEAEFEKEYNAFLAEAALAGHYSINEASFKFLPSLRQDKKTKELADEIEKSKKFLSKNGVESKDEALEIGRLALRILDIIENIGDFFALPMCLTIIGIPAYLLIRCVSWLFRNGEEKLAKEQANKIIAKLNKLKKDTKDAKQKEAIDKQIKKIEKKINDIDGVEESNLAVYVDESGESHTIDLTDAELSAIMAVREEVVPNGSSANNDPDPKEAEAQAKLDAQEAKKAAAQAPVKEANAEVELEDGSKVALTLTNEEMEAILAIREENR